MGVENSCTETSCSQERKTDKLFWLDRSVGSSPFEKCICLELLSKSNGKLSRFCLSCADYKGLGVETESPDCQYSGIFHGEQKFFIF